MSNRNMQSPEVGGGARLDGGCRGSVWWRAGRCNPPAYC